MNRKSRSDGLDHSALMRVVYPTRREVLDADNSPVGVGVGLGVAVGGLGVAVGVAVGGSSRGSIVIVSEAMTEPFLLMFT